MSILSYVKYIYILQSGLKRIAWGLDLVSISSKT